MWNSKTVASRSFEIVFDQGLQNSTYYNNELIIIALDSPCPKQSPTVFRSLCVNCIFVTLDEYEEV